MRIHRERTPSVLFKDSKNRGEEEEKKSLREQRRKEAKTQKKSGKPLRSKNKSIAKSRHSAAVFLVLLATFCCSLRRGGGLFKLASCCSTLYHIRATSASGSVWKGPMQQEKATRPFFFVESPSRPWLKTSL